MKHTPGPWFVNYLDGERYSIVDNKDMGAFSGIAIVAFHDDAEGETKANARLIAAAPELLEALKQAVAWMDGERTPINALVNARKIIAKAEGK